MTGSVTHASWKSLSALDRPTGATLSAGMWNSASAPERDTATRPGSMGKGRSCGVGVPQPLLPQYARTSSCATRTSSGSMPAVSPAAIETSPAAPGAVAAR